MGVIHNSPHPIEPPMGATRTAPAAPRRFKPGLVLEAQFQLAPDHASPFSLCGKQSRDGLDRPGRKGRSAGTLRRASAFEHEIMHNTNLMQQHSTKPGTSEAASATLPP